MFKIQTIIEANDVKEVAALTVAFAAFTQALGGMGAAAPQPQEAQPAEPHAAPPAAAAQADKPKRTSKKQANGATEPAPPAANDNAAPVTIEHVHNAAVRWMKEEAAKRKLDVSKTFPAELRNAASAIVEKAVGRALKNLTEIPADKMAAVIAAFESAA